MEKLETWGVDVLPQNCIYDIPTRAYVNKGIIPYDISFLGCNEPDCYHCSNVVGVKMGLLEPLSAYYEGIDMEKNDFMRVKLSLNIERLVDEDILPVFNLYRFISNSNRSRGGKSNRKWFKEKFPAGGFRWYEWSNDNEMVLNIMGTTKTLTNKRLTKTISEFKSRLRKEYDDINVSVSKFTDKYPVEIYHKLITEHSPEFIDVEHLSTFDMIYSMTSKKEVLFGDGKDILKSYLSE